MDSTKIVARQCSDTEGLSPNYGQKDIKSLKWVKCDYFKIFAITIWSIASLLIIFIMVLSLMTAIKANIMQLHTSGCPRCLIRVQPFPTFLDFQSSSETY